MNPIGPLLSLASPIKATLSVDSKERFALNAFVLSLVVSAALCLALSLSTSTSKRSKNPEQSCEPPLVNKRRSRQKGALLLAHPWREGSHVSAHHSARMDLAALGVQVVKVEEDQIIASIGGVTSAIDMVLGIRAGKVVDNSIPFEMEYERIFTSKGKMRPSYRCGFNPDAVTIRCTAGQKTK
ncbi:hypothetical protein BC830DRAFT_1080430 [Chytriomyces sp. MP71]|nr:hypothetical protein BC830DRAFT_1080430 [Chytriomyces sp. MP71]